MKFKKYVFAVVLSAIFACGNLFSQDFLQMGIDKLTKKDYKGAIENFQKAVEKTPKLSNAYFYLAEAYFLTGQMDNAEVNLKKAIDYDDENAKALKRLGDVLFQKSLFRDALKQYTLALKFEKRNADFLLAQGKSLIEIDSIDQAVQKLSLAIEISPKNPELYIVRGAAYLKMGVPPMAIDNLKKASELDSNNAEAHIRLGDIYMSGKLKMYREAINEYIKAVELDSTNERILGKVSHILYYNASSNPVFYARAANYYRQYLKYCDTNYVAYVEYGYCLMRIRPLQLDNAIESFNKSLKLRKKPSDALRGLALAHWYKSNFKDVAKTFGELEKIDTLSATEYDKIAKSYNSIKDSVNALKYFLKVIKIDSTYDVYGDIANLYLKEKNYSEAGKYLKIKVLLDTTTEGKFKNLMNVGSILYSAKDLDGAREAYLSALEIKPDDVRAHYMTALIYGAYGKNDSVKQVNEHLKKIIELAEGKENDYKNELAYAYVSVAFSDYTAKNYQKALDNFNKALKFDSKNQGTMFFIAGCYAGLAQKEDACKACDRLLKVNPKHKDALELKKKLNCWMFE